MGFGSSSKGVKIPIKPILGLAGLLGGGYMLLDELGMFGYYNSFQIPSMVASILLLLLGFMALTGSFKKKH